MSAKTPYWEASDGTRWVFSPELNIWTGWQPGEDGQWSMDPPEFRRTYGEAPHWDDGMQETLTLGQLRQLFRECVTVVKPGETLIIMVGTNCYTSEELHRYQQFLDAHIPDGIHAMVVVGDSLGIAEKTGD